MRKQSSVYVSQITGEIAESIGELVIAVVEELFRYRILNWRWVRLT